MAEHFSIPSREEAERFSEAYLAAQQDYYESLEEGGLTMDDYISREEAQKATCAGCSERLQALCEMGIEPQCKQYKRIMAIPAAPVRPVVRGKWLKPKYPYAWYKCECDQCGYKALDSGWTLEPWEMDGGEKLYSDFVTTHPFCTGCGADMREAPK